MVSRYVFFANGEGNTFDAPMYHYPDAEVGQKFYYDPETGKLHPLPKKQIEVEL